MFCAAKLLVKELRRAPQLYGDIEQNISSANALIGKDQYMQSAILIDLTGYYKEINNSCSSIENTILIPSDSYVRLSILRCILSMYIRSKQL